MGSLRVTLLGGFQLERDGRALPPIPAVAGRSLLAHLVLDSDRAHPREVLISSLWPDLDEPRARRRLSQALWQIQTVLGEDDAGSPYLLATSASVRLNPEAERWVDVDDFESSLDTARREPGRALRLLEGAIDLYRGDLLAGFYDGWFDLDRERLAIRYLDAVESLVALYKGSGRYERALRQARRLSLQDPYREAAHREVMRLSHLLGRSHEAIAQYEVLEALLGEELGVAPTAETRALAVEIRELHSKGVRPFVPAPAAPLLDERRTGPLVGRRAERSEALTAIEAAIAGRGGVVLVEGEPGVGKTKLLATLGEDASWRGAGVAVAACREETMLEPYRVVRDLVLSLLTPLRARHLADALGEALLAPMARIVPELVAWVQPPETAAGLPADGQAAIAQVAAVEALSVITAGGSAVFLVDDLQWIDRESLQVLRSLAGNAAGAGIVLVLAYQREAIEERSDLWEAIQVIDRNERPIRVSLTGLDLQETTELVERAMGNVAPPPEMAETIYFETGGNPLFVLETLRAIEPGTALDGFESVPFAGGVRAVIDRRIRGLDEDAATALGAVAVLGDDVPVDVLSVLCPIGPARLAAAISVLLRRGMLEERGDGLAFRHGQIRAGALDALGSADRRRLHRMAADAYRGMGATRSADVARHLAGAGDQIEAAEYARTAAGDAVVRLHAYATARHHLQSAADLLAAAGVTDRFDVLAELEHVLDVLGDRPGQRDTLASMASCVGDDRRRRLVVLTRQAALAVAEGRYAEAMCDAGEALTVSTLPEDRARAHRAIGEIHGHLGDPDAAARALDEALRAARGGILEADIHRVYASMLAAASRHDQAVPHLDAAIEGFRSSGDDRGLTEASSLLGTVEMERGRSSAALEAYERAIATARRIGYRRYEGIASVNLANLLFTTGRPVEALQRYGSARVLLRSIGDRRAEAFALTNRAMLLHEVFGDDDAAAAEAAVSLPLWRSLEIPVGEAQCLELLARIAARAGRTVEAMAQVAAGLALMQRSPNPWLEAQYRMLSADIHLTEGRMDAATVALQRASELIEGGALDSLAAALHGHRAMAALARGDLADAEAASERAVAAPGADHVAWHRRARVLAASGRSAEAEAAAVESWRLLQAVLGGMSPDQRAAAIRSVPEFAAIRDGADGVAPRRIVVELGGAAGPVEVTWTVSHPDDLAIVDVIARRRHRLARILAESRDASAEPGSDRLASALEVSVATVRRDLAALRAAT